MSLVHGLYEQPHEALQTLVTGLKEVNGLLDVPSSYQPPQFSPVDPEVAVVPFVMLHSPLATLRFILGMLQRRMPGTISIWHGLELSDERFAFDCDHFDQVFKPNSFFWMRIKFNAYTNSAPLCSGQQVNSLAGLVALTALACHPERLRRMAEHHDAGIWLPGLRTAPRMSSSVVGANALVEKKNVLRIGKNRRFAMYGASLPHVPSILFASAPGDMMDGGFTIPNVV